MRKKILLLLALIASLCMIGCGSGAKSTFTETAAISSDYFSNDMKDYSYEYSAEEGNSESDYFENSERKLIKTIHMSSETELFDEFLAKVTKKINELGGYAEEYSQYGQRTYRSASIIARIPKKRVNEFLQVVEGESNITSRSESIEDVTLQYVDVESHKTALETEQKRLLEILEKAETVEDILAIENQLSEVRYQIDSMESQLRSYDNKVDFTTIYLNIEEVVRYTPVQELSTWGRIKTGFVENLYDLGGSITDIFVWFVVYLPNLLIYAVIITLIVLIIKKIKKRKASRKENGKEGRKDKRNESSRAEED